MISPPSPGTDISRGPHFDLLVCLCVLPAASRGWWSHHMLPLPVEEARGLGCVGWGLLRQLWPGDLLRSQGAKVGRGSRVGSEATWACSNPTSSPPSRMCHVHDIATWSPVGWPSGLTLPSWHLCRAQAPFLSPVRNNQATLALLGPDTKGLTRMAAGLEFLALIQGQSPRHWAPTQLSSPASPGCPPYLVTGFARP